MQARQLAHDLLQSVGIMRVALASCRPESLAGTEAQALAVIVREVSVIADLCEEEMLGTVLNAPIEVGAIAERVIKRMRTVYSGELRMEVGGPVAKTSVRGSANEWERSLLNLVENACRAAGPDGKVLVRCTSDAESLQISVADTGPGFGAAAAGRSSLGMVAVMQLVESHQGHLELRRSELGGAELTIVVPLEPRP